MESHMFQLLHEAEESWWYRGRATVVSRVLSRFLNGKSTHLVVDFGAGFGAMLATLKKFSNFVYAFEPDAQTQKILRKRGYEKIFNTKEEVLAETYDLIALFDVLEHIEDDAEFLTRVRSSLVSDGHLVITVPAYEWLWSNHDIENHHFRRYTKNSLLHLLVSAGYRIEYASYWDTFLFVPAAVIRLLGSSGGNALRLPKFLNDLLLVLIKIEALCMRIVPLPFGLSIIVYATKKPTSGV